MVSDESKDMGKLNNQSRTYFPSLDCLRFFGWLVVFNRHTIFILLREYKQKEGIFFPLIHFFCNGELGVSLFFVLSGFLITYIILNEQLTTGKFNIRAFYIRRALRIWPLYFSVVLVGFIVIPSLSRFLGSSLFVFYNPAYYIVFLSNIDYIKYAKWNTQYDVLSITWSVSIEEQFYIVYALLIYFFPKKLYPFFLAGVIVFSGFFRFMHAADPVINYFHSFSVMSDLAIGGVSAWLIIYKAKVLTAVQSLSKNLIWLTMIAGIIYILLSDYIVHNQYFAVYNRIVISLFFVFVILEQNYAENSIFKFSRLKTFSQWGKISYGMYLFHPIVIFFLSFITSKFFSKDNIAVIISSAVIAFILTIWVSKMSYKYFENFFLSMKEKFKQ